MESNDESDDPSDFFVESVSCGLRSTCRWMMEAGEWDELAELGGDDCPRSGVAPRILLRSMIAFWLLIGFGCENISPVGRFGFVWQY